jgi:phosphoserine phosphatase
MPEGYAAYLLDRDVDALRSVYAECGVTALLDDATTIINAHRSLGLLVEAIKSARPEAA